MKLKLLSVLSLGLLVQTAIAQTSEEHLCGMELIHKHLAERTPGSVDQMRTDFTAKVADAKAVSASGSAMKTTATGTIPVVFHIILNEDQIKRLGGVSGIEQRVLAQIDVINRDYNMQNADSTRITAGFKPLYGNVGIQFGLAHRKPDGTSTPGYEIITTAETGFNESGSRGSRMGFSDAKLLNGVATAWDPTKYLNVWVVNPLMNGSTSSILGLAIPPSFTKWGISQNEMGVVLNYGAFGVRKTTSEYYISGITGGRTLVHELGHFFELWHIWGDDNGLCPDDGGSDDGISDTPPQANATYGTVSGIRYDSCSSTGAGIMYMNYMDYVNDAAMVMFTKEQAATAAYMVSVGQESYTLTQHPELLTYPTSVADVNRSENIDVYPNPSNGVVHLNYNTHSLTGIQVFDMAGRRISEANVSGTANYNVDLSNAAKGVYFIHCQGTAGNTVKKVMIQ